jgi:hypothetical protein
LNPKSLESGAFLRAQGFLQLLQQFVSKCQEYHHFLIITGKKKKGKPGQMNKGGITVKFLTTMASFLILKCSEFIKKIITNEMTQLH